MKQNSLGVSIFLNNQ